MHRALILQAAIICISLIHTTNAANKYYDCRRRNSPCVSHPFDCNLDTGECECPDDRTGFDCGLLRTQLVSVTCTVTCNYGICYQPDSQSEHACYCNDQYYGDDCTKDRVSVLGCAPAADNIAMNINMYNVLEFDGTVTVTQSALESCAFEYQRYVRQETGELSREGYFLYNSVTQGCVYINTEADPNTYVFQVYVHYDKEIYFWNDVRYVFSCNLDTVTAVVSGQIGMSSDLNSLDGGTASASVEVSPVRLDIMNANDVIVSETVVIGDRVAMRFTLTDPGLYVDYLVDRCIITDLDPETVAEETRQNTEIISGRCPTERGNEVFTGVATKDGTTTTYPLSVFKYISSDTLYFQCELIYCTELNLEDCQVDVTCDNSYPSYGRKKREETQALGQNQTDVANKVTRARLFVVSTRPRTTEPTENTDKLKVTPCFKSLGFLLFTASTGILIVIAVTMAIAVCAKYNLKRKSVEK